MRASPAAGRSSGRCPRTITRARRASTPTGDFRRPTVAPGSLPWSPHDPRGDVLPAVSLGPPFRLLQGGQQPDPDGARPDLAAAGAEGVRGATAASGGDRGVNKIEALKAARDGLDVTEDLARFAREGWKTIGDDDKESLKWVGVFLRRPTPGHFMMRVRMPNGILTTDQVRLLAQITRESGRSIADITTRQQLQLRW